MPEGQGQQPTVFTIGHGTRTSEEFAALLEQYGIEVVVDVRRFPRSQRNPQFNRDTLRQMLRERGIGYVWLGELLGGYRSGGYEAWMDSEQFRRGLELLEKLARRRRCAVMCAERLFFRCHRRFIADSLVARGWRVVHIYDERRAQQHRPSPPQPRLL